MNYLIEIYLPVQDKWEIAFECEDVMDADSMLYAMHKAGVSARVSEATWTTE